MPPNPDRARRSDADRGSEWRPATRPWGRRGYECPPSRMSHRVLFGGNMTANLNIYTTGLTQQKNSRVLVSQLRPPWRCQATQTIPLPFGELTSHSLRCSCALDHNVALIWRIDWRRSGDDSGSGPGALRRAFLRPARRRRRGSTAKSKTSR